MKCATLTRVAAMCMDCSWKPDPSIIDVQRATRQHAYRKKHRTRVLTQKQHDYGPWRQDEGLADGDHPAGGVPERSVTTQGDSEGDLS